MAGLLVIVASVFETGFAVRLTQNHGITSLPIAAARTHRVTAATDATCTGGGLWQGDWRRAGIGRCRCRRCLARAWPRVLLVFDRDVVIRHG
jgi:hypothetical protein